MRGGSSGQEGRRSQNSEDSTRRASSSVKDEEEEDDQEIQPNTGVPSKQQGPTSPRETIVLDASYPPPGDFPDEDEDEDDALEVVVETLLGDTFRVRVSQWDTAAGLKTLLYRTQGIPMSHQHLLLGQAELVDDACLIDQGVVDGSTLRLVLAMKGGPINSRRLPSQQDLILQGINDMMDNRVETWEGNGGRTVTLLVLRDGDNVNVYRVVENQDGSFSPLNESFSSMASSEQVNPQSLDEGAKTRARMKELQARMDAVKLEKKAKKEKRRASHAQRPISRGSRGGGGGGQERQEETLSIKTEVAEVPERRGEPGSRPVSNNRSNNSERRMSLPTHRVGRSSRPTTQERSEMRRNSLSKNSAILDPLPKPSVEVDFTRRKPLDGIGPKVHRLSAVNEEHAKSKNRYHPPEALSKGMKNKKKFEAYRKSLVKHVMVPNKGSRNLNEHGEDYDFSGNDDNESDGDDDDHGVLPKREVSKPFYMPPLGSLSRRNIEGDRLNRSHNQDHLRVTHINTNNRPKTSPEVLEHRPGSTGGQSTISDRIHLRAADDRLVELCNILSSSSRANSRQSHRQTDSPPDTTYPPSLSTSFSGSHGLSRNHKNNSVSVSLSSLKSHRGTPPSPGRGALVASGSREQRDRLREFMDSQAASSSRRTTPENLRHQGSRRLGSGRLHPSPAHLPPVTPPRRKNRQKPRCDECSKRLSIVNKYDCRCGRMFCTRHRHPETHACTFDYRTEGRRLIELANPLIKPQRLPKI